MYQHSETIEDEKSQQGKHDTLESYPALDPEQLCMEKRLVRKLDMTLMPVVWTLYLFNYLDRNNIA